MVILVIGLYYNIFSLLCVQHQDYPEKVVASFPHKIQSEHYGRNISVSIEGIALEHFSKLTNSGINPSTK